MEDKNKKNIIQEKKEERANNGYIKNKDSVLTSNKHFSMQFKETDEKPPVIITNQNDNK
nr:hypothetical protein [uncultured Aminipila sp.]